jgi:hypothetical protein
MYAYIFPSGVATKTLYALSQPQYMDINPLKPEICLNYWKYFIPNSGSQTFSVHGALSA